jgi:hypothetical protein
MVIFHSYVKLPEGKYFTILGPRRPTAFAGLLHDVHIGALGALVRVLALAGLRVVRRVLLVLGTRGWA